MKELLIGSEKQFLHFPSKLEVGRNSYFLLRDEAGYKLLSRVCPHAGYTVEMEDDEWVCPLHGWTFELHSGLCKNVKNARLETYEVVLRDGMLFAQML